MLKYAFILNPQVQHLVWFIKHLKFCGTDDGTANDILGPDDIDQQLADDADQSLSNKKVILINTYNINKFPFTLHEFFNYGYYFFPLLSIKVMLIIFLHS